MPKIILIEGTMKGRSFPFDDNTVFIGRSFKNDIQIHDEAISRKHLKIFRIGKKFFVEDLKSTNGTLINGEAIVSGESYEVEEKDNIQIGDTVILLDDLPLKKPLEGKRLKEEVSKSADNAATLTKPENREQPSKDINLIFNISELIKESFTLNEFFEKALGYILDFFPRIDRAAIFLFDFGDNGGRGIKDVVSISRLESSGKNFLFSQKVIDQIMRKGKAIRISDAAFEKKEDIKNITQILKIKSILCAPIISANEILGAIYMDSLQSSYGFRKGDLRLLNSISSYVAAVIEKRKDL
jgi:pSer/pThr/pTyr-binding forkhead associated (FHA) protein